MKIWVVLKIDTSQTPIKSSVLKTFDSVDRASELAMKLTAEEQSEFVVYTVDSAEIEVC